MTDTLSTALRLHQSGQLDQAARLYQDILNTQPNHADALHLLGVIAIQKGQPQQAIPLIGKAIAINPNHASFHCNLAEALRALGQLDRAAVCCRTALRLNPNYPEAANNLGLVLLAQDKTAEAIAQFQAALKSRPDFAMACNNLGNAYRLYGDAEQALTHFRRAVEIDPHVPEARSNLGQMLLERDQPEEALAHCREAVRLRPNFPEAHNNLGNVLRELDRLPDALASYHQALKLNPNLAMTFNNIGQAHQEDGKFDEAIRWYHEALQREPTTVRFHCNLASALQAQDRNDEALARFETALRLDPVSAEAHHGVGQALHEVGRSREALEHYREAVRLKPDLAPAHLSLGTVLEEMSQFDDAEACFRTALHLRPEYGAAFSQLATMRRGKLSDADVETMRRLLADPERPERRRTSLHFGLAQVLDSNGDFAGAAEQLQKGNALRKAEWERQGKHYLPAEHSRWVDQMLAGFSMEFFERTRGFGLETVRPVFIVGLPRSATTLTESILASHSQVFGAGELRLAREDWEELPKVLGRSGMSFECLPHLDRLAVRRLAQRHLDRLREHDDRTARIVDKMPDNYLYLGLLAVLFPKARFIHTRRDLRDVAVSCWMTNFKQIRWTNDPEHIAARFRDYERIMEHWRKVLPVPLLEIDYEQTVNDLEGVARKLVDWVGLEWEPQCLAFHESSRPVRTASVAQVRQPIYKRSVERWRNYEGAMGEWFNRLRPGDSPR